MAACLLNFQTAHADPATARLWDVGQLRPGQNLATSLREKKISSRSIQRIVTALDPYVAFKRLQPDTAYRFVFDPEGVLREFTLEAGHRVWHLTLTQKGEAVVRPFNLTRRVETGVVDVVVDTDLGTAIRSAGEAHSLVRHVERILLTDLDPAFELHKGDRFRIIVERIHLAHWVMQYGRIEAFEVYRGKQTFLAIGYNGGYYDASGHSLTHHFLRFPLSYRNISSQFMKQRKHPILGGVRPHRGIDFGAPIGTPVWSIADGEVIAAGWRNGFGRTVVIRHVYGYETLHAHLKAYGPGIKVGRTVRQKQVLGYIGTSGLSTGPHLHFELTRDGQHRNPLKEQFPQAVIASDDWKAFSAKQARVAALLSPGDEPEVAVEMPHPVSTRFQGR
jgi:murein DD-endopeptidase MepM/ murein hydrolase activator NlpD